MDNTTLKEDVAARLRLAALSWEGEGRVLVLDSLAHIEALEARLVRQAGSLLAREQEVAVFTATTEEHRASISRLQVTAQELRQQIRDIERAQQQYKEGLRELAKSLRREHDWCLDGTNEVLDRMGLEHITERWTVTITDTGRDREIGSVDVEADTESEAIDKVKENLTISVTWSNPSITVEFANGDGDGGEETWTDRDWEREAEDSDAEEVEGSLSFSAEIA